MNKCFRRFRWYALGFTGYGKSSEGFESFALGGKPVSGLRGFLAEREGILRGMQIARKYRVLRLRISRLQM